MVSFSKSSRKGSSRNAVEEPTGRDDLSSQEGSSRNAVEEPTGRDDLSSQEGSSRNAVEELKGVTRKSIRSKRAGVSRQGESSQKQCATKVKSSQFPCREHRLRTRKATTVISFTCVLLFVLTDRARASASFEKQCILKWSDVKKRLPLNPTSTMSEDVLEAANQLAGNFVSIRNAKHPACITPQPNGTLSYFTSEKNMTQKPYQVLLLVTVQSHTNNTTLDVLQTPVLKGTDDHGQTWLVLPVNNNGTRVLAFVKDKSVKLRDVHFYKWEAPLDLQANDVIEVQGSNGDPSASTSWSNRSEGSSNNTDRQKRRYNSPPCRAWVCMSKKCWGGHGDVRCTNDIAKKHL